MNELREAKELHPIVKEIKDRYPKLFDLLCDNYDPEFKDNKSILKLSIGEKMVSDLFKWSKLEDIDIDFWCHLNSGNFEAAKQIHPEYFEESNVTSGYLCQDEPQNPTVSISYDRDSIIKMLQYFDPIEQVKELHEIANVLRQGWIDERGRQHKAKNEAHGNYNLLDKAIENL